MFGWHNALFPKAYSGFHKINTASFRGKETMQIVGGNIGYEKNYYEAPSRKILEDEMKRFLDWFNNTDSTLIKASIAHLWFVIIHPFDDGNGRITRAITDLVLSKIENPLDITLWCEWFLQTLYKALLDTKSRLNHIIKT